MEWRTLASQIISPHHVVVPSVQQAESLVYQFEIDTVNTFTVFRRNKGFKEEITDYKSHRIHWEDTRGEGPPIDYSGIPFILAGWDVRECQFGPDRNKKKKENYNVKRTVKSKQDHVYTNKTRKLLQLTKKIQCPARVYMKRIWKFPEYRIKGSDSQWKRKQKSADLRSALGSDLDVTKIEEVHIFLPENRSHSGHITGAFANLCQPVDGIIKEKIGSLMNEGVTKVSEMKRHLQIFCKNELFPGHSVQSRRFSPTDKDIRNHMALHKEKSRFSSNDQDNLQKLLSEWENTFPEDSFFLRKSQEGKFIFVHQSQSQRRLLNLYGQEICLLDATYKTSKYSMPIFFVCINTNVGYSIAASFITADETKDSIQEGLRHIKEWNDQWYPKYFMTDYDISEINAIEETFEDCLVYLCDFHREQAWERWLKTLKNNCATEKDDIISLLRDVANSSHETNFESNVNKLKSSLHWKKHPKFRSWFQHTWLSISKRWVRLFRNDLFNMRVSTTNGLERQHLRLKQQYLSSSSDKSLTSLVTILVTQFIPDGYKRYVEYNVRSLDGYRAYASNIPRFLHNRPKMLVSHCLQRMPPNVEEIPEENITHTKEGMFRVRSVDTDNVYTVDLEKSLPCCTCIDWQMLKLPCKHMLAIFHHYPGWDWDFLPEEFRESPHFNLDPEIVKSFQNSSSLCQGPLPKVESRTSSKARENDNSSGHFHKEQSVSGQKKSRTKLDRCKELVKSIQSSLFNLSEETIGTVVQDLEQVANHLKRLEPLEDGLPVINVPKSKRKRTAPMKDKGTFKSDHTSIKPNNQIPKKLQRLDLPKMNSTAMLASNQVEKVNVSSGLEKVWRQRNATHYILAKTFHYNVTDGDIISLHGKNWLTDQVIDAYLDVLTQAEIDKGRRILHLSVQTMTRICEAEDSDLTLSMTVLGDYELIIGVHSQRGYHWNLVILDTTDSTLHFINPLGFSKSQADTVLRNWRQFTDRRCHLEGNKFCWNLIVDKHSIQNDGYNCGVYCLLFAEHFLNKQELTGVTKANITQHRVSIAENLLLFEVYMRDSCPCCGYEIDSSSHKIQCASCLRYFHKSNFCAEMEPSLPDKTFVCKICIQSITEEGMLPRKISVSSKDHNSNSSGVLVSDESTQQVEYDLEREFPLMTRYSVGKLLKSNFSEKECESLLDALGHCTWLDIHRTMVSLRHRFPVVPSREIKPKQALPYLGKYGDGYVDFIPPNCIRNLIFPVNLRCLDAQSVFGALSVMFWGTEEKIHFFHLLISCEEVLSIQVSSDPHKQELCRREFLSKVDHPTDEKELIQMHLQNAVKVIKMPVRVFSKEDGSWISQVTPYNDQKANPLDLLKIQKHDSANTCILPLVEGPVFLNRTLTDREKCGAESFGYCHCEGQNFIQCIKCLQQYHPQCIDVPSKSVKCGCHVLQPRKSSGYTFYRDAEQILEIVNKMDLQRFLRNIAERKYGSKRYKVFCCEFNPRRRQIWKDKNALQMGLFSYEVIEVINKHIPKDFQTNDFHMNVAVPEVLVEITKQEEGFNRLEAELFLNASTTIH